MQLAGHSCQDHLILQVAARLEQHFQWQGATLLGKTPQGRATVELLQINAGHRLALRRQLIVEGVRLSD